MLSVCQDAFNKSFSNEEALHALRKAPDLRSDEDINLLLRWASTVPFFKVRKLEAGAVKCSLSSLVIGRDQDNLTAKARESLCKLLRLERHPPNHCVCREGELGVTFYVIFSGSVGVQYVSAKPVPSQAVDQN